LMHQPHSLEGADGLKLAFEMSGPVRLSLPVGGRLGPP
jgi:hypothetical protein